MTDDHLHLIAREEAEQLIDADKKQLRFNDIVETAKQFYGATAVTGVREMVDACDKTSPLYVAKQPMWRTLREQYAWMVA